MVMKFKLDPIPQGHSIGCFFRVRLVVGVEESIVSALYRVKLESPCTAYGSRISRLNLTFLHDRCVLNRLSGAHYEVKF
jgi:predicted membrane protein